MMHFQALDAAILSPALRVLLSHWLEARCDRLMPAWRDIDPTVIGKYLPMVSAWRYDFALGTFIGRLAGEEILAALGTGIRGRPIEECHPAAQIVLERYKMVMTAPCVMYSTGRVYIEAGRYGTGERIVLPLADDGINGDGVIGATEYRLNLDGATLDDHQDDIKYYPVT